MAIGASPVSDNVAGDLHTMLRSLYAMLPLPLRWKLHLRHVFLRAKSSVRYRGQIKHRRKIVHQFRSTGSPISPHLRTVLVLDSVAPRLDEDAGSLRTFSLMKMLTERGVHVTFLPVDDMAPAIEERKRLASIGVECITAPEVFRVRPYLKRYLRRFDAVFVERVTIAAIYVPLIKQIRPDLPVVFDTHDLHFLRYQRQAKIENSNLLRDAAKQMRNVECDVMRTADHTIVVSRYEQDLLKQKEPGVATTLLPLFFEADPLPSTFQERNGVLFIGGFRHAPNADAVTHFIHEIWPHVHEAIPDAVLHIIGGPVPAHIRSLASAHIRIEGFVEDLRPLFNTVRLSVSPLRYGAGVKGKTGTSLAYGLPSVISPATIEGTDLVPDQDVLLAETPEAFADKVIQLYQDEALWQRLRDNGLTFIEKNYSFAVNQKRLEDMLLKVTAQQDA